MDKWWEIIDSDSLMQGDLLENCTFFKPEENFDFEKPIFDRIDKNLIIITQSCDLENGKARVVALCPAYRLDEFANDIPRFQKIDEKENLRKGRYENFLLLQSTNEKNNESLVIDFRDIISLPLDYLKDFAKNNPNRYRLNSPYREYLSQNFARFYMRVGLPIPLSAFKK